MPYVITDPCIDVRDQACVTVCPVACIHFDAGKDRKLYIDPNECIGTRAVLGDRGETFFEFGHARNLSARQRRSYFRMLDSSGRFLAADQSPMPAFQTSESALKMPLVIA